MAKSFRLKTTSFWLLITMLVTPMAHSDDIHTATKLMQNGKFLEASEIAADVGGSEGFTLAARALAIHGYEIANDSEKQAHFKRAITYAKKAVELGIKAKPWVKTSLAPGSKVVTKYLDKSNLLPYLESLGFNIVGYGCTTCIGNSGDFIKEIQNEVIEKNLAVASVLSGNRNFEARIHPNIKMNFLMRKTIYSFFNIIFIYFL